MELRHLQPPVNTRWVFLKYHSWTWLVQPLLWNPLALGFWFLFGHPCKYGTVVNLILNQISPILYQVPFRNAYLWYFWFKLLASTAVIVAINLFILSPFICKKASKQQSRVAWLPVRTPHKLTHQAKLQAVKLVLVLGNSRLHQPPSRLSTHSIEWDKGSTKHPPLSSKEGYFPHSPHEFLPHPISSISCWRSCFPLTKKGHNVCMGPHVSTSAVPPQGQGTGQWERQREIQPSSA